MVLDDFKHKLNPKIMGNLEEYKKLFKMRFGKDPSQNLTSSFKGPAKLTRYLSSKEDYFPNPSVEKILAPMEPWEVSSHCLRSLRHKPKK